MWDIEKAVLIRVFKGHTDVVTGMALHQFNLTAQYRG